ncbi:MAG: hydrogenase maturation protease [Acidimicrobiia bacterium]|nr:hydrogenase maturation protease [Acidimicrobiia bacterium]
MIDRRAADGGERPGSERRRLLVIGIGNRHRGDDAIGPLAAEAVGARFPDSVDVEVVAGDPSTLPLRWSTDRDVVVIDAAVVRGSAVPGTLIEFDGLNHRWPVETGISSHGFDLATTIELARRLGRLPASLTVLAVAIDAGRVEHLAPPSQVIREAVDEVVDRVASLSGLSDRLS